MASSTSSHETISERAYFLWESEGRPEGRADDFWLRAEQQLQQSSANSDSDHASEADDPLNLKTGPEISNLDRALPPRARREARADRQPADSVAANAAKPAAQPHHFLILVDRAHLRIYGMDDPTAVPALVTGLDAPAGRQSYAASASDNAGQFPGSRKPKSRGGTSAGGTNDERLPMQQERDRRLAQEWADRITAFFTEHTTSTWDYAAGPELHNAVLDRVSDGVRQRLRTAMLKDLVNHPAAALRQHVAQPETTVR